MTIKPLALILTLGAVLSSHGAYASSDSDFASSLSAIETLALQARQAADKAPAGTSDGSRVVPSREDVLRLTIASLGATTDEAAERIIASVGQLDITNDEYCKVIYKLVNLMVAHRDPVVRVRVVRAVGMIASIKNVPNAFVSPIGATLILRFDSEPGEGRGGARARAMRNTPRPASLIRKIPSSPTSSWRRRASGRKRARSRRGRAEVVEVVKNGWSKM